MGRRKTGEISLGKFHRPHGIERATSGRLYVTCDFPASIVVVDAAAKKVLHHCEITGQTLPHMVSVTHDETKAYTANSGTVIDTATDTVMRKIDIPGHPARLQFTPDGKHLPVSLMDAGDLAVVETATARVVHRFHAGANVEGMTTDAGGRFGYISAQGDNKVVRFSLRDWKPVLEVRTEARPDPLAILGEP